MFQYHILLAFLKKFLDSKVQSILKLLSGQSLLLKTFYDENLIKVSLLKTEVCPEVKLCPLTDPSQKFSSQKRTLHKIFPVKNGLVMNLSLQNPIKLRSEQTV